MLNSDSRILVNESIAVMAIDFSEFENTIFDLLSKKMEEKNQFFHFDQRILVSAFCAYIRDMYVGCDSNEKDLRAFADLFEIINCDGAKYIITGTFLMSVLRDLLRKSCNEEIINAWAEAYICVYEYLTNIRFQPEISQRTF